MCDFDNYIENYLKINCIDIYSVNDNYMLVKNDRILFIKKDYTLFQGNLRIHTNFSLYNNTFLDDENGYDINTLFDLQIMITNRLKDGYKFRIYFDDENGNKYEQNYLQIVVKDEFCESIDYTDIEKIEQLMDIYDNIFESKKIIVLKFVD